MPVSYVDEDGSEVMRLGLTLIGENGEWGTWIPPCRLRVRTAWPNDATSWNDKRLLLLPASQTFEMPRSGTKRVVLEMTRGGMAELVFKEPRTRGAYQGYYFLEYELRDDRGEVVPVGWYAGGPWDRNVILDTPPHVSTLTTDGAKRTTALPAGRYTLKLWASFAGHELESMTVPLSIVQGKVTKHVVQLVHEPRTRR